METVYIETSVVSYLGATPPADTLAHQWHVWTEDWWRIRRPLFECVMSAEVLREAAEGDPEMSRRRLAALDTLTVLRRTPAVDELSGGLPRRRPFAGQGQGRCGAFGSRHGLSSGLPSDVESQTPGQRHYSAATAAVRRTARLAVARRLHAAPTDGDHRV